MPPAPLQGFLKEFEWFSCERFLGLVEMRMSDARPVPQLHVVCGPPAGGKTVYGRALAARERAVLLDIDIATGPVVEAGMEAAGLSRDDRDSPSYKEIFREPVYEALFQLAETNLAQLPVVVVGPFTSESQDAAWPARLKSVGRG